MGVFLLKTIEILVAGKLTSWPRKRRVKLLDQIKIGFVISNVPNWQGDVKCMMIFCKIVFLSGLIEIDNMIYFISYIRSILFTYFTLESPAIYLKIDVWSI